MATLHLATHWYGDFTPNWCGLTSDNLRVIILRSASWQHYSMIMYKNFMQCLPDPIAGHTPP